MPQERFEIIQRPDEFIAGEYVTVKFRFTVGDDGLPAGDRLKLGLPSAGWGEPLVNHRRYWRLDPEEPRKWLHYRRLNTTFELDTDTGAYLSPYARHETRPGDDRCIQRWWITFEVIAADFAPGDTIDIVYGDTKWGEAGAEVQPVVESDEDFSMFVEDPDGRFREVAGSPIWVDIVAGKPSVAFLRLPTISRAPHPQPRVYVTDRCGNPPSGEVPPIEPTVKQKGDVLRADAKLDNMEVRHNPSIVRDDACNVYWGDIHGKTNFSGDGLAPIDDYLQYGRDHAGMDFTAVTDHSGCLGESWITTQEKAAEYTSDGEFIALKGFEYSYENGHRNVYFDNHEIEDPWPKQRLDLDGDRPFFQYLRGRRDELISIPHHTLVWTDWDVYDPELEPICEIYSMWGCSERTVGEGNRLWDKSCIPGGGAQAGLARGYRMGFIAASDTHSGFPGRQHPDKYGFCFSYQAGLAAIRAPRLTADALIDALKARNCYATTGAQIYLDFYVDGHGMGSEIEIDGARHITGRIVGTTEVSRIDIVRNNEDWKAIEPAKADVTIDVRDDQPAQPGTFYYLRVLQADGQMAWSSPVWLD